VLAKLKRGPLAIDTETTGLNWRNELVGSINLAAGETAVFAYKGALAPIVRWLSRQITREQREFVFHNAKFDMHMLRTTFGLHFPYPVHDTRLSSHLLDNRGVGTSHNPNHHLKDLAVRFVDPYATDPEKRMMEEIKAAGGKSKGDWLLAKVDTYAKYSALDAWYTLQLHKQFIARIRHWPQPDGYPPLMDLYENERWLTLCLRDMEERGVKGDRQFFSTWQKQLQKDVEIARQELLALAGRPINWNSPDQVRALLFNSRRDGGLGIKSERLTKKNKRKPDAERRLSTDKTALVALNHPIGAALLHYRKLTKQLGTFATGLLNAMTDDDTIHTNFNQNVETGRMSSSEPNLQQEDKRSGVRKGFVPRKGLKFRFADYSQGEMRFAAIIANEPSLIRGFNEDPDFDTHTGTAAQMFGVKHPTPKQRDHGKTMNFAMLFGAGENKTAEGLMDRMTIQEARQACAEIGYRVGPAESPHRALASLLRQRYKKMLPAMPRCAKEREQMAAGRGFSINLYGRHRYLPEDECYKAFNSDIQGSLADCGKRALVAVYRECQLNRGELALVLQVHDEIVYESEGDPRTDKRVLELLSDTTSFSVPIVADMSGSTTNWQDKTKVKL
jgi:DNA polymerase-1